MNIPSDLATYGQWSGWFTIFCILLTVLAFIFGWSFRFRIFGVTSFMVVLTSGIYALDLGLYDRVEIPGAVRYTLVYDNSADRSVITVPPSVPKSAIEPTLRQAAVDLYSYGRTSSDRQLTIDLRTLLHPEPGVTKPLYLGEVKRSLASREDENMKITLFADNIAQLPPADEA